MKALPIVVALDPVDDIQTSLSARFVANLIDSLDFQGFEEALHRRVVPGVSATAHRNVDLEVGGQFSVRAACILTSNNNPGAGLRCQHALRSAWQTSSALMRTMGRERGCLRRLIQIACLRIAAAPAGDFQALH